MYARYWQDIRNEAQYYLCRCVFLLSSIFPVLYI